MNTYLFHNIVWDLGVKRPFYNGKMTKAYKQAMAKHPAIHSIIVAQEANSEAEARDIIEKSNGAAMKRWTVRTIQ